MKQAVAVLPPPPEGPTPLDNTLEAESILRLPLRPKAQEIAVLLMSGDAQERELGLGIAISAQTRALTVSIFLELSRVPGGVIPGRMLYRSVPSSVKEAVLEKLTGYGNSLFASSLIQQDAESTITRPFIDRLLARGSADYLRRLTLDVIRLMPGTPIFNEVILNIRPETPSIAESAERRSYRGGLRPLSRRTSAEPPSAKAPVAAASIGAGPDHIRAPRQVASSIQDRLQQPAPKR